MGRFNPNHWDPVYAAETGLKAPIQTGEMSTAYLSEMCVNYLGRNFFTTGEGGAWAVAAGWRVARPTAPGGSPMIDVAMVC